jgi:hypothetical protein
LQLPPHVPSIKIFQLLFKHLSRGDPSLIPKPELENKAQLTSFTCP